MKSLFAALALLSGGCTVVGSAYVEKDLPQGKAGTKVEVRLTPPPQDKADVREKPPVGQTADGSG